MKKILIIGSGIAGLSCAVTAAENGCEAVIASPYPSERAQSVMAAGGINAALDTKNDTPACHAEDTLKGGGSIAGRSEVQGLCEAAPGIIRRLEAMGTVFTRDANGEVALRAFGGQTNKRTAFAGACTGKQIVTALTGAVRRLECEGTVTRRLGLQFHSALIADGVCCGALFYNEHTRETEAIYADATVMATGGQNKLFGKTTGTELCDGYVQGKLFEQGVALKNLEFIQYHPTTIETPMKRMLISEAARGEGGRLFYFDGDKKVYFMEDKYGPRGNLMPRDIVSKCIYDAPSQVYLDITFLGSEAIHARLEEIYELCRSYAGLDVTKEYIPVYPSVHFFMGGIAVNAKHQTSMAGLYAIGECASIYHGANRLGGNSLLAAVYGGQVAAREIAVSPNARPQADFSEYISAQTAKISALFEGASKFPAAYVRQELAQIMNENLGITRCAEKLEHGLKSIDFYLDAADKIHFDALASAYQAYSVRPMLLLAKAVLASALARKETRGAHIREDYPDALDAFAACSIARYENGEVSVCFKKEGDAL